MTKAQKLAINYWKTGSKRDFVFTKKLFDDKAYNYSLYFLQLSLEKILKGVYVAKMDDHPPYSHDLVYLARKAEIDFYKEDRVNFKEISEFSIAARYDNEKFEFYKKATKEFAEVWLKVGKRLYNKLYKLL